MIRSATASPARRDDLPAQLGHPCAPGYLMADGRAQQHLPAPPVVVGEQLALLGRGVFAARDAREPAGGLDALGLGDSEGVLRVVEFVHLGHLVEDPPGAVAAEVVALIQRFTYITGCLHIVEVR